jgi:hypothetical protein
LECSHGLPAPIVAKSEFIKIDLELFAAHAMMGVDQPLLKITNSAVCRRQHGLGTFAQVDAQWLSASHEMNIQIHRVLGDTTGYIGMAGERDGLKLAKMVHPRVKASTEQIVKALEGDYRAEQLFALKTAMDLYDAYQLKIMECEKQVEQQLEHFDPKLDLEQVLEQNGALKARSAQVRLELQRQARLSTVCGLDLTQLPGLSTLAVETIIAGNGLRYELLEKRKALLFLAQALPG